MPDIVPKLAIDYLKNKELKPAFSYKDVWRTEHAKAFTVAKAMKFDVLQDIKGAVDQAIEEGQTLKQFQKNLEPILRKKGWWGKKTMSDPLHPDKDPREVQLGSSRRLRKIYRTNLRSARAKGQWDRGMASPLHTHILYLVGPSANHRKEHLSWNGLILPKDDPFWKTHYPPNGWECKCYVRFITERKFNKMKKDGIPLQGKKVRVQTDRPSFSTKSFFNDRTGEIVHVPEGIDPGFDWNPGIGRTEEIKAAYLRKNILLKKKLWEKLLLMEFLSRMLLK